MHLIVMPMLPRLRWLCIQSALLSTATVLACLPGSIASVAAAESTAPELTLVVMDPLSKPLSCDCVQGYAQREYGLLQRYLTEKLERKVNIVWNESLVEAMKETKGKADIVIGKHSVVLYDARQQKRNYTPIARLTDRLGGVTQRGLIVVRSQDEAKAVQDLNGYRIFLGPPDADEKNAAAKELLKSSKVEPADDCPIFNACSEAAVALLKLSKDAKAAAVISSYAEPLLEGCGSVKKGDLRVIARTSELPFVTVFVAADVDTALQEEIKEALSLASTNAELMVGLETLLGFLPWSDEKGPEDKEATSSTQSEASTAEGLASKKN